MRQHYRPVLSFLVLVILHFKVLRSFVDIKIYLYKAKNVARLLPCEAFGAVKGNFYTRNQYILMWCQRMTVPFQFLKGMVLMQDKRITIFCGHYGSGKTNLSVNYALYLKSKGESVVVSDLDIINPFFRTKDSEEELRKAGIELISSEYANSSLDIPTIPAEMQRVFEDKSFNAVLDVGGDERGSVALGRFAPMIREENNYNMVYVVNFYRPLTRAPEEALTMLKMIEDVTGLKFSAIVNNSCVGVHTTAEDVLSTVPLAEELSSLSGVPVAFTSVQKSLYNELSGKIENLFPLTLQEKYFRVTGIK